MTGFQQLRTAAITIILAGLQIMAAHAQTVKKYVVKPGQNISEAISYNNIYSYDQFVPGTVLLRNGSFGNASLNYNSLQGEMQFLDPGGDTLSLADEKNISFISVKTDTFYYNNGYLKLVANYGKVKLANRKLIVLSNRKRTGGLNQSGTGEIETFNSVSSRFSYRELTANETMTFNERIDYFLGDQFNHFILASKKNVLKMFGEHEREVTNFLEENRINFTNQEDLKKLCLFLQAF